MKITVLYNTNSSTANDPLLKIADEDTIKTANAAAKALSDLGHDITLFDITEESFSYLLYLDTEFYFNLSEGIGSIPKSFVDVAEELEKIDIPFSGSSSFSLGLTTDKGKVKELLTKKGFSTPRYTLFNGNFEFLSELKFPMIVKPSGEDSSIGIDQDSVAFSEDELKNKIYKIKNNYVDPLLIEEYIDGREFAVTIMGNGRKLKILPIYEIKFGQNDKTKIYDYRTKWDENSETYKEMSVECPAKMDTELQEKIEEIACSTFQITKCSDYARVDVRVSKEGKPFVLEINANPGVGPNDEAVSSAKSIGLDYSEFLASILRLSLKRYYNNLQEKYSSIFPSVNN